MKKLEFIQIVDFTGLLLEVEANSLYFPDQGPRPGFFPDEKSQKKGAGLLYVHKHT